MYTNPSHIKKLYKLMYDVHNILIARGIQYSVTGGTLLGAVRHKGIIPWDDDLDIEVNENAISIFRTKDFRDEIKKHNIRFKKHPEGWYKFVGEGNIQMDIFPTRYNKQTQKIEFVGEAKKIWPQCSFHKVRDYFPLKKYKFGKIQVLGPQNPIPILNSCYKRNWSKIGYITMDADHQDLEEPVKVAITRFLPARDYYIPNKMQLLPRKNSYIYMKDAYLDL